MFVWICYSKHLSLLLLKDLWIFRNRWSILTVNHSDNYYFLICHTAIPIGTTRLIPPNRRSCLRCIRWKDMSNPKRLCWNIVLTETYESRLAITNQSENLEQSAIGTTRPMVWCSPLSDVFRLTAIPNSSSLFSCLSGHLRTNVILLTKQMQFGQKL